jgi:uncharacterized protein (TIRG00374 family)
MVTRYFQGKNINILIASITLGVLAYLGFFLWGGWRNVLEAFESVGVAGILIVLFLSLINYSLRFIRWQLYLVVLGHPISTLQSCLIYVAGFALTTTPGKAGEMLRGVFLKSRGMPYIKSTAAFLSERLSDLVAIVLLSMLGISLYPQGDVTLLIGVSAVMVGLLLLSNKDWLNKFVRGTSQFNGKLANILNRILSLLIQSCSCHTPLLLIKTTFLSLLAWSAEAYAFYLILYWMGLDASIPFAFSVYSLSTLAGAISFIPGGLGSSEVVMLGLLAWAGMPQAEAVAATIIIRLATLWFAVALGGIAMLFGGRIIRGDIAVLK